MSRPQIVVNVTGALPRRGLPSIAGTAFMVFAGAAGPAAPVVCQSSADATAAAVPDAIAAWVGDALEQGAPQVIIVRATAVDPNAVTQPEWAAGLAKFTADLGPGQVLIPGVSTSAAYGALLAHAAANTNRCVLLDTASAAVTATVSTAVAGLTDADGAQRAAMISPWATVPAGGGVTRDVPGSVIAAGLAARGDSVRGHTNQAPIFDQGRGAGVVTRGTAVTTTFTDADADTLYDAGVDLIRMVNGAPTLTGWRAISDDAVFKQFNIGRLAMQLVSGLGSTMLQFLGRSVDGRGQLFGEVEGALRGYLLGIYAADGLYGATADDAFDVDVANSTTPEQIAAGQIHAAVEISAAPHTEKITINVVTAVAEGA